MLLILKAEYPLSKFVRAIIRNNSFKLDYLPLKKPKNLIHREFIVIYIAILYNLHICYDPVD